MQPQQDKLPRFTNPTGLEPHLRKIFDANILGIAIYDFDGRLVKANGYFLEFLGLSAAEAEGRNVLDFTAPQSRAITQEAMLSVFHNGTVPPFEKDYIRADGETVSALVGAVKSNHQILAYVLDNSARKRDRLALAEAKSKLEENVHQRTKALVKANCELSRLIREVEITAEKTRQSQRFLDSVIENIPNLIFVKDARNLNYVRLNKAVEDLIGKKRSEILGKNDFDIFPRELAELFNSKDAEVLSRKQIGMIEEEVHTPDGIRYLHTRKLPILDDKGVPQYLLGIAEDITQRKLAETQKIELAQAQAARAAAEKTTERVSFLSEASAALNESLDIRSLLNGFARVIVKEMADWCIVDLYQEEDRTIDRMVAVSAQGEVPLEVRNWWSRKTVDIDAKDGLGYVLRTGESRIFNGLTPEKLKDCFDNPYLVDRILAWGVTSSMMVPLAYHGHVIGALSFVSLKRKVAYDELDLSVAQDLAKRASLALENARLYSQANEASRAKSAFLANISHEIRTPLGAMLGFAELVLDDPDLNSKQRSFISTIARNGRQLLRLVDEILDLSKVESERISIEQLEFSLPTLLQEIYSLLNVKAIERGLAFQFEGIEKLPDRVKTDPLRLRQILLNVIGNALKFTEKGSVEVHAHAADGFLHFSVKDTGIGLSEEQAARIFQPFVQADESMTRKYGGTGLGLFLARKLARLLGGDVTLKASKPNVGSEFLVSVAIDRTAADTPSLSEGAKPSDGVNCEFPDDFRVLMVDDSEDNRELLTAYMANSGIKLDAVDNGCLGVEYALKNHYNLILMDIQMPGMDGFQALNLLTRKGYHGPVVALTAHAMKGDRERCLQAGFSDYLHKPISRKHLMECLRRFINDQPSTSVLH